MLHNPKILRPLRDPVVERLLAEIRGLDEASVQRMMLPAGCYTEPAFFEFEQKEVFARSWICVGRIEELPEPGDVMPAEVAGEPMIITRAEDGQIRALSAVCRHRGQIIPCEKAKGRRNFRCPLHYWTYDLEGRLVGAPRMGDAAAMRSLREAVSLPQARVEIWYGFIFVNLDPEAPPVAQGFAKLEPFWEGYRDAGLVPVPPSMGSTPLPWNWKTHVENFTDAYHPEYVHRGTHDFAPSNHPDGGVVFTPMEEGDNAIVRSVPMIRPDGGMMLDGWGEPAMFPAIETLAPEQRKRLTFALMPPSMTLVFAPGAVAYTLIRPVGALGTLAANDRVTGGGWLLPRSTLDLPDFAERAETVLKGASKIWAQDLPINLSMQAGKNSRFLPDGIYGPLEVTLQQFNLWLFRAYARAG